MFKRRTRTSRRSRRRPDDTAERLAGPAYHSSQRPPETAESENTGRQRLAAAKGKSANPGDSGLTWRLRLRRTGVLTVAVIILLAALSTLIVAPNAKISPVTAGGANKAFLRSQTEYQTAANKLLSGSIWNHNKITINTGSISRQMLRQFPELAGVSLTLPLFGHQPTVYVQPARAALVVAGDNGAFVVDTNGKALMPSANLPTAQKLPQVVDKSGLPVRLNQQVLTTDDVGFIQTVLGQLLAKRVGVTSMVLPPASRELDVYITGQPYFVKFNLQDKGNARQQAGTYLAAAAELQRGHVTPAHYIDVRVDGRAYYQ